jgi:multidrug efflux pump subunit AcrB
VVGALFASTITSIAIFLPILFMKGLEGQLFADLALTLSVAVATSMIAAITILPVASNYFEKDQVIVDRLGGFLDRITATIIDWTNTRERRIAWVVSLLAVPALLTWLLAPKLDFLPQADSDGIQVFFSMPEGICGW